MTKKQALLHDLRELAEWIIDLVRLASRGRKRGL